MVSSIVWWMCFPSNYIFQGINIAVPEHIYINDWLEVIERPSLAHSTIGHVAIAHRAIRHIKLRTVRLDTVLLRTVRLDTALWRTVRLDTVAFGHNTYSCIYASIKLIIIGNIIKIV